MAISTLGTKLLCGDSAEAMTELCRIKDFPDLMGEPNLIDVTDLQDEQQTNIPGTKTSDNMAFTANYDKETYDAVDAKAGKEQYYGVQLSDGSGWTWKGSHTMGLPGKGVDEAIEFTVNIVNSTPIERKSTLTGG